MALPPLPNNPLTNPTRVPIAKMAIEFKSVAVNGYRFW